MDDPDAGGELPGRDVLLAELATVLERGQRPVVLVVALRDLDGLASTDPDAASAALRTTGHRLQRLVRSSDLLARVGDHAFALAGTGVAPDAVGTLVERVLGAVAFPCEAGDSVVSLLADVGWAVAGPDTSAEALVAAAEADLARQRPA